jgi:hypothetical protein
LTFKSDLENTIFFSLATDASNKSEKIFFIIIKYFTKLDDMKKLLIKMSLLKYEKFVKILHYYNNALKYLKIPLKKCVTIYAKNAITNFNGINRKG